MYITILKSGNYFLNNKDGKSLKGGSIHDVSEKVATLLIFSKSGRKTTENDRVEEQKMQKATLENKAMGAVSETKGDSQDTDAQVDALKKRISELGGNARGLKDIEKLKDMVADLEREDEQAAEA